MCGICGFVSKQNITIEQLKAMNDTMYHRGPDDSGVEIFPAKGGVNIGLAQRRLSIMDLSPLGHQPMHSVDKRISVVFNGEIYNFMELREELTGYPFTSHCDTEVIIAAYLKWGISCVDRFNGMFAICIYDRETEEVFLVRDRIGKKPLYYEIEGENMYFASELKPIMKRPGFAKAIRQDIIPRFLYHHYINAPESVFENVYKLEPGSVLKWQAGQVTTWKYWDIKTVYHKMQENPVTDYNEAKAELKRLLQRAVSYRMISDVPLGSFLSGGYDSSLITALAQEHSKEPVKTFCIGFSDEKYNEAIYAKEVAKHLGTDHTELYISEKDMFDMVADIPKYYDEPMADSSQIPSMLVAKLAKQDVTVVLSGDGGDEFFCGYNVYDKIAKAKKLDFLGGMVHGVCNIPGIKQLKAEDKLPFAVRVIAGNRERETKTQFPAGNYAKMAKEMVLTPGMSCHYPFESKYDVKDWQVIRMLLDMDTYLPGDILCKVDRASMKYSLESRCPIMDKDVMEYSFRMAHELKYNKGNKKRMLKDIVYDFIPKEMLERPKTGFSVPLDKWLRGPLKEQLTDMCSVDTLRRQGIFDAEYVNTFLTKYLITGDGGPSTGQNYSRICWALFVFQQWYQEYME